MDRRRVLIVGGGIAGLALARTGVAVEVIEREPAWRPAGTGIYLPGNAARALRALGLEAQVASPSRRDRPAALPRPPRQAAVRGRRRRAVGSRQAVPGAASGRSARTTPGGGERRAHPYGADRRAPRAARRHRLSRVQRRNQRRVRSRGRGGRDPKRRAPAHIRADGGAPARGPSRLALSGAPTRRAHDLVGDAGAPRRVSDPSTRLRA
jgi:2-polyprenyl-6-methoxyphenol hydroxylase-like FAD-dependent oxidoreductase